MFMIKRNKKLLELLEEYISKAGKALELYADSMKHYLEKGNDSEFELMVKKTHELESAADDLQLKIEKSLYEKSLLPDSREDLFVLIEKIDQLPNKGESILRQIYTQNIRMPAEIKPRIWEIVKLGIDTFQIIKEGFFDTFAKMKYIRNLVRDIDSNESLGDHLEQKLVYDIFRSDIGPVERIMLRDIVLEIGHILDISEDIGDALTIFAIKRQV